jgi:hypothetical protein
MFDELAHLRHREAELLETTNRYLMRARAAEANLAAYLEALKSAEAWLHRWATHNGGCRKGSRCTCGLTAVRRDLDVIVHDMILPEEEA